LAWKIKVNQVNIRWKDVDFWRRKFSGNDESFRISSFLRMICRLMESLVLPEIIRYLLKYKTKYCTAAQVAGCIAGMLAMHMYN